MPATFLLRPLTFLPASLLLLFFGLRRWITSDFETGPRASLCLLRACFAHAGRRQPTRGNVSRAALALGPVMFWLWPCCFWRHRTPAALRVISRDGAASYAALPHSQGWLLKCTVGLIALLCLNMYECRLYVQLGWVLSNNCIISV